VYGVTGPTGIRGTVYRSAVSIAQWMKSGGVLGAY
jgi:hypothetical protein